MMVSARQWRRASLLGIVCLCAALTLDDAGEARVLLEPSWEVILREVRHMQQAYYCVAKAGADSARLQEALDWACGPLGKVDCTPLQSGGSCYTPSSIVAHASYAFDVYYSAQNGASHACNFSGLATLTTTDPSTGACVYPAFTGSTSTPNAPTTPLMNSTTPTPPTILTPPTTFAPPSTSTSNTTLSPPFTTSPDIGSPIESTPNHAAATNSPSSTKQLIIKFSICLLLSTFYLA